MLVATIIVGAVGYASRNTRLIWCCELLLVLRLCLVVATVAVNVDSIFEILASFCWVAGLGSVAIALPRKKDVLYDVGSVLLAMGMVADCLSCVASLPPIAHFLNVNFSANAVTQWNFAPIPGNLLVAAALLVQVFGKQSRFRQRIPAS